MVAGLLCYCCVMWEAVTAAPGSFDVEPNEPVWRKLLPIFLVLVKGCADGFVALGLLAGILRLLRV